MTINSLHFLSRYFPIPTRLYIPAASHMANVQPYRCGQYTWSRFGCPDQYWSHPHLDVQSACQTHHPPAMRSIRSTPSINIGTLQVPTTFSIAFSPAPADIEPCGLDIRILGINTPSTRSHKVHFPHLWVRCRPHRIGSTHLPRKLFPPPTHIEPVRFDFRGQNPHRRSITQ